MEKISPFIINFFGKVVIMTVAQTISTITSDEHGMVTEAYPLFYEGILVDEDQSFYYLATKRVNEIDIAINKLSLVSVIIQEQPDIFQEVLNQMEKPVDEKDIN